MPSCSACSPACCAPSWRPTSGLYSLWLWRADPRLRLLVACSLLLSAAAWVVPEWIGSGNPLDGGRQATSEPTWSLSHSERPWLSALELAHDHAGLFVEVLALAAVAWALVARRRPPVLLAAVVVAEVALFAVMTRAGFSGNPRYVPPALTLACVLAGAGMARILAAAGGLTRRPSPALGGALAAAALAVVGGPFVDGRVERLRNEAREWGFGWTSTATWPRRSTGSEAPPRSRRLGRPPRTARSTAIWPGS
jgi:hypothetical protein